MVCQNSAYNRLKNNFIPKIFSGERIPYLDRNLMIMSFFSTFYFETNKIQYIVIFQKVNKLRHPKKMVIYKRTIHREAFVCHGLTNTIHSKVFVCRGQKFTSNQCVTHYRTVPNALTCHVLPHITHTVHNATMAFYIKIHFNRSQT